MPITRRHFHSTVASAGFAALTSRAIAAVDRKPLRVIAYNVYACHGWPDDRAAAKQLVAQGEMAQKLATELARYDADIINFSESPSEAIAKEIATLLGMHHVRFPSGGSWPGTILSRFEIRESRNVPLSSGDRPQDSFMRHWGRAVVELPGGERLAVHSAHLHPSNSATRMREIKEMLASMQADLAVGRSQLLIGDLNHEPDTAEHKLWTGGGWVDTFAKVGRGSGLTIKSDRPERRIDYIFAAGPIAERTTESRPLFKGAFRVDLADSQSFALSDHLPQFAQFNPER